MGGNGRTVYNNKGKPVKQYEPFFSSTPLYEAETELVETGVTPTLFYDPVGRVIATLHPNHTYEKVLFNPWYQESWDVNDTLWEQVDFNPADDPDVGRYFARLPQDDYLPTWYGLRMDSAKAAQQWPDAVLREAERKAAEKAVKHAATPAVAHLDSLGRTFLTVAHNRVVCDDHDQDSLDTHYETRVELDIEGNQRAVIDARNRAVMTYDYDLLGNVIHQDSMDAGERWKLNDIGGNPLYAWDSRGHHFWSEYDELRRPVHQFVRGSDTQQSDPRTLDKNMLVQKIEYGEAQTDAVQLNLRTRAFKSYDNAGVVTSEAYDFKGNPLRSNRQLTVGYKELANWAENVPLETDANGQAQRYTASTTYDALNRPITSTAPDGSVTHPFYNEANLLERLEVNLRGSAQTTTFVNNIDYNAKGQRILIEYGSGATDGRKGVTTTYTYDDTTFRLIRLYTRRDATIFPGDCDPPPKRSCGLQNLHYAYDPVGNITHIQDDAQQTIYFNNTVVEPSTDYVYDAIYRLVEATGREHLGNNGPVETSYTDAPRVGLYPLGDVNAMGLYIQRYAYDEVGNILTMKHRETNPAHPGWSRPYQYAEDSNRLLSTGKPDNPQTLEHYEYDPHGNMIQMPHLPEMLWDYQDQLRASSRQVVNNGGSKETTWYVYDANGQRIRKVTELANGNCKNQRIYFGSFEVYREYNVNNDSIKLERETLHVMDNQHRIALVETKTKDFQDRSGINIPVICYQLGNHLGSASVELDNSELVITYEEYYPYGSTSYQAGRTRAEVCSKRYRYSGKKRDEETGLNYHGGRYYITWLGRWVSPDPSGISGGINLFAFVYNRPIISNDPNGKHPLIAGLIIGVIAVVAISSEAGAPTNEKEAQEVKPHVSDTEFVVRTALLAGSARTGVIVSNATLGPLASTVLSWAVQGMFAMGSYEASSQAVDDIKEGKTSTPEQYAERTVRGAAVGAVMGAVMAPVMKAAGSMLQRLKNAVAPEPTAPEPTAPEPTAPAFPKPEPPKPASPNNQPWRLAHCAQAEGNHVQILILAKNFIIPTLLLRSFWEEYAVILPSRAREISDQEKRQQGLEFHNPSAWSL
ncbi:RHS repeat-associated core domain-containing protein [Thiothrix subterranea]|uniref:RHS repeat-associated core domain-containing protein n=1 Tax=Thiothrix subterranea TaxID=2735563 RepID=UPI00280B0877|nr:RHS repeat-associated core domain-containing protein [Thiothrix subterranea]